METATQSAWATAPYALPLLLLWPLLLRLVKLRSRDDDRWSTPVDLGLALGLGLFTAALKAWALVPVAHRGQVTGSDIPDVCDTVIRLMAGNMDQLPRPPMGALPAAALIPLLGLRDGVYAASLLATALLGAGVYLWARALANREAGVTAALLSCAVAHFVIMPRSFSFYPAAAACYVLCAAGAAAALRWPGKVSLALAGVGLGLTLLVDHIGLIYATPMLALCLYLCRVPGNRGRTSARLLALLLPVCLSWGVGHWLNPDNMPSFEDKLRLYDLNAAARADAAGAGKEEGALARLRGWARNRDASPRTGGGSPGYRWGHAGPVQLFKTYVTLALMGTGPVGDSPDASFARESEVIRQGMLRPWLPLGLVALLAGLGALFRHRLRLVGAVVILSPFAALLMIHLRTEVYVRFLLGPLATLPVLLGVAVAFLVRRRRAGYFHTGPELRDHRLSAVARPLLLGAVTCLLVLGLVPSWLSPRAPWRDANVKINHAVMRAHRVAQLRLTRPDTPLPPDDTHGECVFPFLRDLQAGHPARSRLYPRAFDGTTRGQAGEPPPPPPPEQEPVPHSEPAHEEK